MCDRLLGFRVLLVDPIDDRRHVLRRRLQGDGATVLEAPGGRAAVRLTEAESFDAALVTLGVSDMSDEELIAALRQVSNGAAAIGVVTATPRQDLARAIAAGAERVFSQPVDCDEVLRYLERSMPPTAPPSTGAGDGRQAGP
jgi:CheY-like chemotaxis protein